jgi:hypothetical protein
MKALCLIGPSVDGLDLVSLLEWGSFPDVPSRRIPHVIQMDVLIMLCPWSTGEKAI